LPAGDLKVAVETNYLPGDERDGVEELVTSDLWHGAADEIWRGIQKNARCVTETLHQLINTHVTAQDVASTS
jgi:hypothetical protein